MRYEQIAKIANAYNGKFAVYSEFEWWKRTKTEKDN